ncbi:HlyC/CorC family transporter [Marinimicrobium alkaliphilum]|uniref:HlyC/CorC family transporter n=1 Tax=Marinimicrobium alkaliphilum TaxID=2202654 RepID=UPI0018E09B51|nr:transporter associated domain-containing protein [Marinimicrobium alkaliphilum]
MTDDPTSSSVQRHQDKSWLHKLVQAFSAEPKSRDELLEVIKEAANNKLLDQEALNIIEGALDVSSRQARELMIPRTQIVAIRIDETPKEFLPKIIESGHSRFPVIGESFDDIKGILLAKDLLRLMLEGTTDFKLEDIIRTANVVPESKRVNVLLREFREKRYHMALVIDEYGGISGLITIEDILEEIVGEIEDETDEEVSDETIKKVGDADYIIKALTPIEDFNDYFKAGLSDEDFDTIGGILMQEFGHLPKRNEVATIDNYQFRVLYADNRQIHLVRLTLMDA